MVVEFITFMGKFYYITLHYMVVQFITFMVKSYYIYG